MSESFNSVIKDGRSKPLVGLLKDIRIHFMKSNEGKMRMIDEYEGEVTPNVKKTLNKERKKVKDCTPICGGRGCMKLNMVKQVQGQCKKQSVLHMSPIRGHRYPVLSYDFCFIG